MLPIALFGNKNFTLLRNSPLEFQISALCTKSISHCVYFIISAQFQKCDWFAQLTLPKCDASCPAIVQILDRDVMPYCSLLNLFQQTVDNSCVSVTLVTLRVSASMFPKQCSIFVTKSIVGDRCVCVNAHCSVPVHSPNAKCAHLRNNLLLVSAFSAYAPWCERNSAAFECSIFLSLPLLHCSFSQKICTL